MADLLSEAKKKRKKIEDLTVEYDELEETLFHIWAPGFQLRRYVHDSGPSTRESSRLPVWQGKRR